MPHARSKLVKTFEMFPHAETIAHNEWQLRRQKEELENEQARSIGYRRRLVKAERRLVAAAVYTTRPNAWPLLKLAGGDAQGVIELEHCLSRTLRRTKEEVQELVGYISRGEDNLTTVKQHIFNIETRLTRLKANARSSTIYSLDVWDHKLRTSELYVPGSLKIREFETDSTSTKYKFTFKTQPVRAVVNNLNREDYTVEDFGEVVQVNIPAMYIDIIRTGSSSEVKFRSVNADDRIGGYVSRGQLHPHQTNVTTPCFGDFDAPLAEAVTDMDIPLAVTVLELFLKQIDSQDGAGSHWRRWWDRDSRRLIEERAAQMETESSQQIAG